jgi:hypothetical protein
MAMKPAATTSLRVPLAIGQLWDGLAEKMQLNKTAVLVIALRQLAKAEGVAERPPELKESDEDNN